jgi:hypothetical protein
MTKLLLLISMLAGACTTPGFHTADTTAPAVLGAPSPRAVAIVRIPASWYVRNFMIRRKFADLVGTYERVAGLERKYFTISDDREFGGIYLWSSRDAAARWFTPEWRASARERYGRDADLAIYDAPFVVEGATTIDAAPIDAAAARYPARATLVEFTSDRGEAGVRAVAEAHGVPPGLVRAYFATAPDRIGVIDLWANDDLARGQLDRAHLARLEAAAGGAARVTWFDAPVLLTNAARPTDAAVAP